MDDYSDYDQRFFNSEQYFYLKNLKNLENNMFSDLDELDNDILSYNDYLDNMLLSEIGSKKQYKQNIQRNNQINQNNYYKQSQYFRQEEEDYTKFFQNINNNKRNINNMKNQRQKLIYNNDIKNNLNQNHIDIPENKNTIIHFYQPIYNNNIQKQQNPRKYYSKDGKIFIINNNPINNLSKRNKIRDNNTKYNNYINNNKQLLNNNGYYLNKNNNNIQNYVRNNNDSKFNNEQIIKNKKIRKSNSNIAQNNINLRNNNNQRGINPQMNYNNLNYINNMNNNNIINKKQHLLNNNNKKKNNKENNIIKNQIHIRDNILNNNNYINLNSNQALNRNKKRIPQNEESIDIDDINLSNIAEDLIETFNYTPAKKNKIDNISNTNLNNLNQIKNNDTKNIPPQIIENNKEKKEKVEFGCQTYSNLEQNGVNNLKNLNINLNNKQDITKPKIEKKDEGTDIQTSLLQFIEPLDFQKTKDILNNENKNNLQTKLIEEKKAANKINLIDLVKEDEKEQISNIEDKKEKEKILKDINVLDKYENNKINDSNKEKDLISDNSENSLDKNINIKKNENLENTKAKPIKEEEIKVNVNLEPIENQKKDYLINNKELDKQNGKTEIIKEKKKNENKDNKLNSLLECEKENEEKENNIFCEYIDTDKEIEIEKSNNQLKRHIKIDLDQNTYFNFLTGGLISSCQVRKGVNGTLKPYEEKKIDIHHTLIMFKNKSTIKEYDKNDIKINKNYVLCENLKEEEIIPELYEDVDYNNEEETENHVKELASSLKRSIDKSINSSINSSVKQSHNQEYNLSYNLSYADGIYDSIHGSKIKTNGDKGILHRLNQVFGSIAEVPE